MTKKQVNRRQRGFSLIELMVVMSITTLIATMSIPARESFTYRACQAEAKQNLKYINILFRSWRSEYDASFSTAGWQICGVTGSWTNCLLTHHDMAVTDCNFGNPLGFKIDDCNKNRYRYWIRNQGLVSTTNYTSVARMKANAFRGLGYGADEWNMNMCQELCQTVKITDNGNGSPKFIGLECGADSYTNYSKCNF